MERISENEVGWNILLMKEHGCQIKSTIIRKMMVWVFSKLFINLMTCGNLSTSSTTTQIHLDLLSISNKLISNSNLIIQIADDVL